MTRDQLLLKIREVLERTEPLTVEMRLADIEQLDSMGWINVISLYDALFSIALEADAIVAMETVKDLADRAAAKLEDEPGSAVFPGLLGPALPIQPAEPRDRDGLPDSSSQSSPRSP